MPILNVTSSPSTDTENIEIQEIDIPYEGGSVSLTDYINQEWKYVLIMSTEWSSSAYNHVMPYWLPLNNELLSLVLRTTNSNSNRYYFDKLIQARDNPVGVAYIAKNDDGTFSIGRTAMQSGTTYNTKGFIYVIK